MIGLTDMYIGFGVEYSSYLVIGRIDMRVSENRGPQYSTLNSRILTIRTPK